MSQVNITKLQKGGTFTIDGIKYKATPEFVNALTTHLRDTAGTDAETLAGLSNALLNGEELRYDSAANTISGMDGIWSGVTDRQNELRKTGSSRWRKWWEAQFDTDAHRFRNALSAIGSFHYQVPKTDETPANLRDISSDKQWFEYTKGDDGKETWNDSVFNASLLQRIDDMTSYLKDPEAGKKAYRLGSGYTDAYMQAFQNLYNQKPEEWDDRINAIKERLRNGTYDDADRAFLKNFFIAKPDVTPEEAAAAKLAADEAANKKKWNDAGHGGLYDRLKDVAYIDDDGTIALNPGASWGWNLGNLNGRNIYFNDDFYNSDYAADGTFDPLRSYTLYNNKLYALNNPNLPRILKHFNELKDAGDWEGADDIIMTRFTDAARENPGIFAADKYSEFLSDHPEYRFSNLTGLYNVEGLKPEEQLVQLYNLDQPLENNSPYREYAPKYVVLDNKGKFLRNYDNFNGKKIRGASVKNLNTYNRVTSEMGGNPDYTGRYYKDFVDKDNEPTGYRVYYNPKSPNDDVILHMPGINAAGVEENQDIKIPAELGRILVKKFNDQDFLKRLIGNKQNKQDFQKFMSSLVQSWYRQMDNTDWGRLAWSVPWSETNRKRWKDLGFKDEELDEVINAWKNAKRNRVSGNREERRNKYLVTAPNIPQEKNGGVIEKDQFGGVAGGSTKVQANTSEKVDTKNKNTKNASGALEFKDWTDADKADMFALIADLSSLGLAIAPGMGIAAAGTGAVGSTARLYADLSRGTKGAGLNYLLNLGMDAATIIPVLGAGIKGANIAKTVGKALPTIIKAASVYGLGAGVVETAKKIASGQKFTVRDVDMLVNALTAGVGIGKSGGFGRSTKTTKTKAYSENFKIGDSDITLDDVAIKKVLSASDQPKALREAIKAKAPNASDKDIAAAAESLLKEKKTLWQRVRGKDGDIVVNAKKKPIESTTTEQANGNKWHDWWYGVGDKQNAYNAMISGDLRKAVSSTGRNPSFENVYTSSYEAGPLDSGSVISKSLKYNSAFKQNRDLLKRQSLALAQPIIPLKLLGYEDQQPSGAIMQPLFKKGGKIEKGATGLKTVNLSDDGFTNWFNQKQRDEQLQFEKTLNQPQTINMPSISEVYGNGAWNLTATNPADIEHAAAVKMRGQSTPLDRIDGSKLVGSIIDTSDNKLKLEAQKRMQERITEGINSHSQGTFSAEKYNPDLNVPLNWARSLYAMKQSDNQLKNFLNRPHYQMQDALLNTPRFVSSGRGDAYRALANQTRMSKPVTSDSMQNDLMQRQRQQDAFNYEMQGTLADSEEFGKYLAGLQDFWNNEQLRHVNVANQNGQLRWQHELENIQAKNANIAEKSKFFDQAAYATQDWWNRNYQTRQQLEGLRGYNDRLEKINKQYVQKMNDWKTKHADDPNGEAAAQELAGIKTWLTLQQQGLGESTLFSSLSPVFRRGLDKQTLKSGGKVSSEGKRSAVTYSRDPYPELLLQNAKDSTEIVKQLNDAVIKLLLQTKPINVH